MQEWMRRHRRILMVFILIFIGIPFVFVFGMPSPETERPTAQDNVIASVGGVPITESELRRTLDATAMQRAQQGADRPTYRDLDRDGTVQRVMEQLVDSALIKLQESGRAFDVEERLLAKQMQRWEMFQDENGRFNHQAWNEWVGSVSRWNDIYDEMRGAIGRQIYLGSVMAPANRVLDRKIDEELKAEHTRLRVKYAKIEAPVTPTEEEALAHYENNPEIYRAPEMHMAEFLAVSLQPEVPELARELVERARTGEDFAELAKTYSDLSVPEDGDMGWRDVEEFVAPHLEPLFALEPGEVSDPVQGPTGFFIYKNEEERVNEVTGALEVRGRQIVLHSSLSEEETEARVALADEISQRLLDGENVDDVATAYEIPLARTDYFNNTSTEIAGVPANDMFQFRSQTISGKDTPWKPIRARNAIYLTRIAESRQGDIPPYEEVVDRARDNVIAEAKRTDEYQERVQEYAEIIKETITSLDELEERFPELEVMIGETEDAFTRKDMLFQQQVYVQTASIFDAVKDAEPGDVAGPLSGFFGDTWFFELVERIEPSEETFAELEDERMQIRERLVQMAEFELLSDYTRDLRERMLASVPYQQDNTAMDRILGRDWEDEGESVDDSTDESDVTDSDDAKTDEDDENLGESASVIVDAGADESDAPNVNAEIASEDEDVVDAKE